MSLNNPGEQVAQSLCVSNSAALRVVGGRIIGRVSRLRRLVLADRFFFVTCKLLPKRRILSGSEFACLARARDRVQPKPFPAASVQTEEMLHFRRRLCEDASDWSNTLCRG